MPFPDYLDKSPEIIFFTDFDGTVTEKDICDLLVSMNGVQDYSGVYPF